MAHVDKHAAGDFCWIELATSDQNAAKKFYSSLFAWVPNDMPMGPDSFYTIFRLQGKDCRGGIHHEADEASKAFLHTGTYISRWTMRMRPPTKQLPWVRKFWRRPST